MIQEVSSKLNDMGADLIESQSNIIDDLTKKRDIASNLINNLTEERDMMAIKLAHAKDIIYALGLDYNKLSDKGKIHYDAIVNLVSDYGEGR